MNLFSKKKGIVSIAINEREGTGSVETNVNPELTHPNGALIAPVEYEILIDWHAAYVPATKKKAPTSNMTKLRIVSADREMEVQ